MKGVVLHSGGMDSTVLLTILHQQGDDCYPLTINYGQRHIKEAQAAKAVCRELGLVDKWRVLDLAVLREFIHSALHGFGDIPRGHYSDEIQKVTVSPNRNMILLAIAAGYAETLGGEFVAYAAHSNDRAIYPDCRPDFIKSVGRTIKWGTGGKIRLVEPLMDSTKADIADMGLHIHAPLALTWSCYAGGERPCLACGTCLERTEAFAILGQKDPALTDEEWIMALQYLRQYAKKDEENAA